MPGLTGNRRGSLGERGARVRHLHLTGAGLLVWASTVNDFETLYLIMLLNAMVYMPTIALNNTVSYSVLSSVASISSRNSRRSASGARSVSSSRCGWWICRAGARTALQLYIGAGAALLLGALRIHDAEVPAARLHGTRSLLSALGLDAFVLFRRQQMVVFFLFAMLLGAALQITNAFGGAFLDDFKAGIRARSAWSIRTCCYRSRRSPRRSSS